MKVFGYIFIAFWAVYLILLGVSAHAVFEDTAMEAFDWIDGGMIFFLILDFLSRFAMQETPAQNIKQYKLQNIPTSFLLHTFLLRMGVQPYNFFWAFFFVPFGLLSIPQFYGVMGFFGFILGWWLMFVLNSYWYLLWRTLLNRNMLFVIIPFIFYAALAFFGIFFDADNQWLFQGTIHLMRGFCQWNPLCWLLFIVVVVPLYIVNFQLQKVAIYVEIAKTEVVKTFKTNNMTYLDGLGVIGEYLKLEFKSTVRNLVVRKQFITGGLCMLMLCGLFSFSDVYDDLPFMKVFICVYCFTCLGVMTLTTVMCAEGNYIDGLMVRKETVLSLLKAKYYFQCLMLIVPTLFSLMPILEGKITVMTALGCLFFTSGAVFPFIFQLAVYNDSTIHLNKKLTRGGHDTKVQMLMSGAALFLPMLVMYVLVECFNNDIAAIAMIVIGLIGTLLHPLWLRNIYNRFMKRRYQNMDGFRNSR
ncbi:MAG: hypothetical protein IJ693_12170 [Bacteroidaceae bacterium]|nr:hypothetical protein [Bacteroidaceae bacterium]MBR1669013.1 hypothetical protein [Bacteroidaceae bacterium]